MIVVSDTSPLHYLVLIGAIEVLPTLFVEIHVPSKVVEELQQLRTPDLVKRWASALPPWVRVSNPSKTVDVGIRLDPGEIEALALAKEIDAETVLMDDRKGRQAAEKLGLQAIGTLTVLEFAAEQKLLELRASLEALRSTNFYISQDYIDAALEREAARKSRNS